MTRYHIAREPLPIVEKLNDYRSDWHKRMGDVAPLDEAADTIEQLYEALEAAKGVQVRVALMCNGKDYDNAQRELEAIKSQMNAALAKARGEQ